MTADLDLSPEAVERLAWRVHESKAGRDVRSEAVATLRALSAENARLRAERDAVWQAGAEAIRPAARRANIEVPK